MNLSSMAFVYNYYSLITIVLSWGLVIFTISTFLSLVYVYNGTDKYFKISCLGMILFSILLLFFLQTEKIFNHSNYTDRLTVKPLTNEILIAWKKTDATKTDVE